MFDVVIRGRCLTVVHDTADDQFHAVVVDGDAISLLSASGARVEIGALTSAMAEAAASCEIAVVARMQGPMVASSAQVRLLRS